MNLEGALRPARARDRGRLRGDLDALTAHAEASGASIVTGIAGDGSITLYEIERGDAKAGTGAALMRRLCDIADAAPADIHLAIVELGDRLPRYYRRFGFTEKPGTDEDDEAGDREMIRKPAVFDEP